MPPSHSEPLSKAEIRRLMRNKRRNLSSGEQKKAAMALKNQLEHHPIFIRSQNIAFYLTNDGEIDPMPLLQRALKLGKHCYLPVIHPLKPGHLWFCRYRQHDKLIKNQYGILEPIVKNHHLLKSATLDLVLTPLVAFDDQGARLGMGGGYYDRTFSALNKSALIRGHQSKPILIGLSHECQKVDRLSVDSWDIPLAEIITDRSLYP